MQNDKCKMADAKWRIESAIDDGLLTSGRLPGVHHPFGVWHSASGIRNRCLAPGRGSMVRRPSVRFSAGAGDPRRARSGFRRGRETRAERGSVFGGVGRPAPSEVRASGSGGRAGRGTSPSSRTTGSACDRYAAQLTRTLETIGVERVSYRPCADVGRCAARFVNAWENDGSLVRSLRFVGECRSGSAAGGAGERNLDRGPGHWVRL